MRRRKAVAPSRIAWHTIGKRLPTRSNPTWTGWTHSLQRRKQDPVTDTTLAPASAEASVRPTVREIGIIMNGVSGRMGYRQHLVRSILAIREQGGIELADGTRVTVKPILVGRSEAKLAELAAAHGIADWTTDLDAALADPQWEIYAD